MTNYAPARQGAWLALFMMAGSLVAVADPNTALAQVWPSRTVTVVVPFAAGSASDVMPRVVLDQVSKQIGHPIVIENRGGAGGQSATTWSRKPRRTVKRSSSPAPWRPHMRSIRIPYNTLRDFVPVIPLGQQPLVLVTAPSKGFKTLGDLITAARSRPGALNFASAGIGSASHFAAERVRLAGVEAQHVPLRGASEGLTEILAGRVDFFFVPLAPALSMINDGKLVALAVSTSRRATALPAVPTTAESGLPNANYDFWVGLFLPAKTPHDIVARVHQETSKALQVPSCNNVWRHSAPSQCR